MTLAAAPLRGAPALTHWPKGSAWSSEPYASYTSEATSASAMELAELPEKGSYVSYGESSVSATGLRMVPGLRRSWRLCCLASRSLSC